MKASRYSGVLLCAALSFAGCGGGSGDDSAVDEEAAADVQLTPAPPVTTAFFGENGNLWKPKADPKGAGAGNVVVLLDARHTEEFDNCEAVLNTGEVSQLVCINDQPWTHVPFSCFGHNDRQTWRANFTCSQAAAVKVTCHLRGETFVFTRPDPELGAICSRWG